MQKGIQNTDDTEETRAYRVSAVNTWVSSWLQWIQEYTENTGDAMGYNRIQGDTGGTGGTIRQKKGRDMWMYFQLKRGLFDGLLTTTFLGNNKMVLRKPHLRKFKTTKILLKLSSFFFFNVDMGKLEIF